MITIKKVLIYGVLIFLAYKGLSYYTGYTTLKKLANCPATQEVLRLKDTSATLREKLLPTTKAFRCAKQKQNFVEALFFKIPEEALNPSREVVDPPFTEVELKEKVVVFDVAVKKDLENFVKIFSIGRVKDITLQRSNVSITASENEKIISEFQNKSAALKELISNLREFRPESTEVASLKTQLAYSLDQLNQTYIEGLRVYTEASKYMAEGEALLAKPKSELQSRRDELLRLKSKMNEFELKFRGVQTKEVQITKDLIQIADEIDSLIRAYS